MVNSSQIQIQNHLNINWKIYSLLSSLPSRLGPAQHSLSSPSFSFPTPAQQAVGAQPSPPLLAPPAHSLGLGHASLRPQRAACPSGTLGRAHHDTAPSAAAARTLRDAHASAPSPAPHLLCSSIRAACPSPGMDTEDEWSLLEALAGVL